MAFKIPIIADLMFPIAVLPDGLFAFVSEERMSGTSCARPTWLPATKPPHPVRRAWPAADR